MQIDELYTDEYETLVGLAARRLGREKAEDVVQTAFTELLEADVTDAPLNFLIRRVNSLARVETKTAARRRGILREEWGTGTRPRVTPDSHATEPREYDAGGLFGFPFNSLGESTWS